LFSRQTNKTLAMLGERDDKCIVLNGECFMSSLTVVELLTNQTLEGKGGVLRVYNCPSFSMQTNKTLTMLGECDNGGRCPYPFPFSLTTMFAIAPLSRLVSRSLGTLLHPKSLHCRI
jgi:hypothetical protein